MKNFKFGYAGKHKKLSKKGFFLFKLLILFVILLCLLAVYLVFFKYKLPLYIEIICSLLIGAITPGIRDLFISYEKYLKEEEKNNDHFLN